MALAGNKTVILVLCITLICCQTGHCYGALATTSWFWSFIERITFGFIKVRVDSSGGSSIRVGATVPGFGHAYVGVDRDKDGNYGLSVDTEIDTPIVSVNVNGRVDKNGVRGVIGWKVSLIAEVGGEIGIMPDGSVEARATVGVGLGKLGGTHVNIAGSTKGKLTVGFDAQGNIGVADFSAGAYIDQDGVDRVEANVGVHLGLVEFEKSNVADTKGNVVKGIGGKINYEASSAVEKKKEL